MSAVENCFRAASDKSVLLKWGCIRVYIMCYCGSFVGGTNGWLKANCSPGILTKMSFMLLLLTIMFYSLSSALGTQKHNRHKTRILQAFVIIVCTGCIIFNSESTLKPKTIYKKQKPLCIHLFIPFIYQFYYLHFKDRFIGDFLKNIDCE